MKKKILKRKPAPTLAKKYWLRDTAVSDDKTIVASPALVNRKGVFSQGDQVCTGLTFIGREGFSILAPLLVVVPPLFKTAVARRWTALILSWLCLGCLLLYVASLALWMVLVPLVSLLTKADVVVLSLFAAGVVENQFFYT